MGLDRGRKGRVHGARAGAVARARVGAALALPAQPRAHAVAHAAHAAAAEFGPVVVVAGGLVCLGEQGVVVLDPRARLGQGLRALRGRERGGEAR